MENDQASAANDRPHTLATDLDGTLIPLRGVPQNVVDLPRLAGELARYDVTLVFITGRHYASAVQAIAEHTLPHPEWLICDVGTSVYRRAADGHFDLVPDYQTQQDEIIAALPIAELRDRLRSVPGLRLQEEEKQGRFKLSFYADAAELGRLVQLLQRELERMAAPYSIVDSVDPFNGNGLIDLLPANVSKAYALAWWVEYAGLHRDAVVFAGDSGNDLAALTAGYRAILVGNANPSVAAEATRAHQQHGWEDRLFLADAVATSGVLQGCRRFGLIGCE